MDTSKHGIQRLGSAAVADSLAACSLDHPQPQVHALGLCWAQEDVTEMSEVREHLCQYGGVVWQSEGWLQEPVELQL